MPSVPRHTVRIAVVSPLFESVPPKLYGGTERVVSYLTDELVAQGHDVTLFASGDSKTRAFLYPAAERSLRLDPECSDPLAHHVIMLDEVITLADAFDVIHFNIDYWHYPVVRWLRLPAITTLHGRLDIPDLVPLYVRFRDIPLVSISNAQRSLLPWANWVATVYHGLPDQVCPLNPSPPRGEGRYAAFLGRASPEKRLDRAIDIARAAGMRLRIAAKIDPPDIAYWRSRIQPQLAAPMIEYVGEVDEASKPAFLGNATALLFPIDWPEPFGLAMIEAMSCGTPVIAWPNGAAPEIVDEGVTGFLVRSVPEAVEALRRAARLDRTLVRERFEQRFSAARMARDYLAVYRALGRRRMQRAVGVPAA